MSKKTKFFTIFISVTSIIIVIVSAILGVYMASLNREKSYWQQKYEAFVVENKNAVEGQIVFVGDSITDLYNLNDYYSDISLKTYNRGIGGDTTKGVLQRMKVSLYDIKPSKIVLMIGINDINGGRTNAKIIADYKQILRGIKTYLPQAQVYCMSVLPLNELLNEYFDITEKNNQVVELNTLIENLTNEFEYEYVNLFEHVANENNVLKSQYTDDGIHLNANGFVVWTNIIKPYLI